MDEPRLPLLAGYLADWRSLLPGGAAGIMQLMYGPLGEAVASQSSFFDDPFARVYRSVPQIWATVLAPDGPQRARRIRDLHRDVKGVDAGGVRYHALDPHTFWWAHATFTWEVFRSIELFHPGGLGRVDRDRLYEETVAWYGLYGVSTRPVPATHAEFVGKFSDICLGTLELTPAAERTLELALAGAWRPPLWSGDFRNPLIRRAGRLGVLGCLPEEVRNRFGIPWSRRDRREFAAATGFVCQSFRLVPPAVNRATLVQGLRRLGAQTRPERYVRTGAVA